VICHALRIGKGSIGRNHVSEMPVLRASDWICKHWPTSKEQSIRRSWMKPVDGDALLQLIGSV